MNGNDTRRRAATKAITFAARFWHWRLKRYLYAKDYGYKAWPIGRSG